MSDTQSPDSTASARAPYAPPPIPPAPAGPAFGDVQRQPFDARHKSPRMAALLSVAPGLGQIYIGYYSRGFVIVATMLLFGMVASTSSIEPIPQFAMMFIWFFNIIDAGRMAAMYNQAVAGKQLIELPDDFKMPAMGGSILGGALLVVFGLLALSSTLLGFSLDWLENWWPIFPIAVGAYLLYRGVQERG